MGKKKPLSRKTQFFLLALVPACFTVLGVFLQPLHTLEEGIPAILKEPDFLITDYFAVGGPGATLLNAGTVTLICIYLVYRLGMEIDGHTITSVCLMFGFSLFGKNVMNIWSILLGVWIYARYHRTSLSRYIYIGFYGTSLSPIITQLMQLGHLPVAGRLLLAIAVGIVIGFVLPPLCTHAHFAHRGFSLYNVGFAGGIIAIAVVSLFKSFGLKIETRLIWSSEYTGEFAVILATVLAAFITAGLLPSPRTTFRGYLRILKAAGTGGSDYVKEVGIRPVLLNMGINGYFAVGFVLLTGGDLNGPTIGSVFTILGFSATGKHLRNIAPVMAGVWIASLTKSWDISDPSAVLALLLSTTLAPIAGQFGMLWGIAAGFLHSSVALNVGIVYSGMNLYNNGFAGGIVAMFLVPLIQSFANRKARASGEISL